MKALQWIFALLWLFLPLSVSAADKRPVILVLGDSLSAAYGLAERQGWVSLMQQRLDNRGSNYHLINASISGEITHGGLARLTGLLQRHSPVIVIIALGSNDGLQGKPPTLIRNNLRKLISQAESSDARVLVLGNRIPPNYGMRYSDEFANSFSTAVQGSSATLVSFMMEGVATQDHLLQKDRMHPTANGQLRMLDNIAPALFKLIEPRHESAGITGLKVENSLTDSP